MLIKRWGKPEDIVGLVEYLIPTTSYVTGQDFVVDGGHKRFIDFHILVYERL